MYSLSQCKCALTELNTRQKVSDVYTIMFIAITTVTVHLEPKCRGRDRELFYEQQVHARTCGKINGEKRNTLRSISYTLAYPVHTLYQYEHGEIYQLLQQ